MWGSIIPVLIHLFEKRPATIPFVVGIILMLSCVPDSPLFIGVSATVGSYLTDVGVILIALSGASVLIQLHLKTSTYSLKRDEFDTYVTSSIAVRTDIVESLSEIRDVLIPDDGLGMGVADRMAAVEDHLEDTSNTQRRILDMLAQPYYEMDETGRLSYANQSYATLFGVSPDKLVRDQSIMYIHYDDVDRVNRDGKDARKRRRSYRIRARVHTPAGVGRLVEFHGQPRYSKSKGFVGYFGTAREIETYV